MVQRGPRLQAREMHADAYVGPVGERQMAAGVRPVQVEAVGVCEHRGVAVCGGDRHAHGVSVADRDAVELHVAGRRSGPRPRRPARGGATPRLRRRAGMSRRGLAPARPGARAGRRRALAIIPSVVSIPPNRSTAALDTISSSLSSVSAAAAASSDSRSPERITSSSRSRSAENASRPESGTSEPAVISVTALTIASYHASTAATSPGPSPSARVIAYGGERARERTAQLRLARRRELVDEPLRLDVYDIGEPLANGQRPERRGKRCPVARVRVAIEAEHARPDHATRREARVVDGVARRIADHLQRERVTGHQPAVERGDPRHRL